MESADVACQLYAEDLSLSIMVWPYPRVLFCVYSPEGTVGGGDVIHFIAADRRVQEL